MREFGAFTPRWRFNLNFFSAMSKFRLKPDGYTISVALIMNGNVEIPFHRIYLLILYGLYIESDEFDDTTND